MPQRRMFSQDIICSEEFIEMPPSSRDLYVQLAIRADDDGFIQPKSTMRMLGCAEDDLKILIAKRFLLSFETGVVVIKHWLIHNMIRQDRYKQTRFIKEKLQLIIRDDKAYTEPKDEEWQPNGNQMATQVRLGKDRLEEEVSEIKISSTVRKTKTHFLNARRKEKGLPPAIPRRSMKQVETTKALLDIDYFKAKGYEMHGMQFFKVESDDRNKVARKLFIKNREVLGDDIRSLIDWWFQEAGEFCDYSPEVAMSVRVVEKFQNSKRKPKSNEDEILKALKAIR